MATASRTESAAARREQARAWVNSAVQAADGRAEAADGRADAVDPVGERFHISQYSCSLSVGDLLSTRLLAWFDQAGRSLPWRLNRDPYRVWLSEIMLQQTQVQTVIPYYEHFLSVWPSIQALAGAAAENVLKAWEGLGYYTRARHLLAGARLICEQWGGQLPDRESELRQIPGIGEYTACAILAMAFRQPVAAVDGNIVRVFARLAATRWLASDPGQRREVRNLAESILPRERPGDWNEALMDLGATICLPHSPDCPACPLRDICVARQTERVGEFPAKPVRKEPPAEQRVVLAHVCGGRVLVRQRPSRGLLAGLFEWDWLPANQEARPLFAGAALTDLGSYSHRFTHRIWQLSGYAVEWPDLASWEAAGIAGRQPDEAWRWVDAAALQALPFPTALAHFRDRVLAILENHPR
jgi:A/G-specific adenine glycosylase